MEIGTKGNIKKEKGMAKVYSYGRVVVSMMENTKTILCMALEFILGLIKESILACG